MFYVVGYRDNDACWFARVRKHYHSRCNGEKNDVIFSKRQGCNQSKLLNYFGFGVTFPRCPPMDPPLSPINSSTQRGKTSHAHLPQLPSSTFWYYSINWEVNRHTVRLMRRTATHWLGKDFFCNFLHIRPNQMRPPSRQQGTTSAFLFPRSV